MKLTREQAIERSIELWEWCAKTGKLKWDWPEWKKYGGIDNDCFLCEYCGRHKTTGHIKCEKCPLHWGTYGCENHEDSQYANWKECVYPSNRDEKTEERKKYAALFLEQLKELR